MSTDEKKTKKKAVPKVVRDLAWAKWIGDDVAKTKCMCCGINEIKMNSFHCGHIMAEVNGGKTTVDNLRPICAACNLSMGAENMDDFKVRCGFSAPSTIPATPSTEEPVFWTPGILLRGGVIPNLIKWRPGTDSIKMGQELAGKYTYRPAKGLYERNRYFGE
jgi:hypothetical protein